MQRDCCKIQNIQWTWLSCQSSQENESNQIYVMISERLFKCSSLNREGQLAKDISRLWWKQEDKWCRIQNSSHYKTQKQYIIIIKTILRIKYSKHLNIVLMLLSKYSIKILFNSNMKDSTRKKIRHLSDQLQWFWDDI
jgi:hypothetical protein